MVSSDEEVIVMAEITSSVLENKAREKRWCVQYFLLHEMKLEFAPIKYS